VRGGEKKTSKAGNSLKAQQFSFESENLDASFIKMLSDNFWLFIRINCDDNQSFISGLA
jgi:hypothetical protein